MVCLKYGVTWEIRSSHIDSRSKRSIQLTSWFSFLFERCGWSQWTAPLYPDHYRFLWTLDVGRWRLTYNRDSQLGNQENLEGIPNEAMCLPVILLRSGCLSLSPIKVSVIEDMARSQWFIIIHWLIDRSSHKVWWKPWLYWVIMKRLKPISKLHTHSWTRKINITCNPKVSISEYRTETLSQ